MTEQTEEALVRMPYYGTCRVGKDHLCKSKCCLPSTSRRMGYIWVNSELNGSFKTHSTFRKTNCTKSFAALVRLLVFSVLLQLALLDYVFAISCR